MLDIEGILKCRIKQIVPHFFEIYIPANSLGIEPGEFYIKNSLWLSRKWEWYIKIYANDLGKKNPHKVRYHKVDKIKISNMKLTYYNEAIKFVEKGAGWFTQEIKASIILPIIKERSKIQNNLIYVDEYWKS